MAKVMFKTQILLLMTALFTAPSDGQISQRETKSGLVNDIRQVDFKNFAHQRNCEKATAITQLQNGKFFDGDGAEWHFLRIAYGDLDGDGSEEAIVLLRGKLPPAGRTLDEIFIYTLKKGNVLTLAHFAGGQRGEYILSIGSLGSRFEVENGALILDKAVLREYEYAPARYFTIKYRWNGFQMVETKRSRIKFLPENMREVG